MLPRLLQSTVMMLRPQDYGLLAGVVLIATACCIASSNAVRPWDVTLPLIASLAIVAFLIAVYYRNLLRHMENAGHTQDKQALTHYRQMESTAWLTTLLKIRQPLPFMRGMAISPDFAVLLAQAIYSSKPSVIVELGCGTSTLIASYILEELGSGRVVSIDHDTAFAAICRRQLSEHGLTGKAEIFDCPLVAQTVDGGSYQYYDLSRAALPDSIDILVIDGPPQWIQRQSRFPALPLLFSRLSPSAMILIDDAARPDEEAIVERWMKQYAGFQKVNFDTEKGTTILYRKG